MKTLSPDNIRPRGELAARSALLSARLDAEMYSPEKIFDYPTKDWPGDWVGRLILGQTMLCRSTGREPAYLDEIVGCLPEHLNSRGYMGETLADGCFDEQQMSGHGWLIRGLVQYYNYRRDEKVIDIIKAIIGNLFLPALDYYDSYPVDPNSRSGGGAESGTISGSVGAWRLSTDVGCAFIPLDGLTAAYELLGGDKLERLIREMIRCFKKIDLLAISAQTHASLTAARAILRFYEITGEGEYLAAAAGIFDLYTKYGMTANYENYNWFGRPEWTEPCAVIDSFILAMRLYINTSDIKYLNFARRIYYNGICREQRPNGGFGCQSCVIDGIVKNSCYEAYWCCSMRGGEGLAEVSRYCYLIDGRDIIVPYLMSSVADIEVDGEKVHIEQNTVYPYEGKASFTVSGVTSYNKLSLKIYIAEKSAFITEYLSPDRKHIDVTFDISLKKESPVSSLVKAGGSIYTHGDLILGADAESDAKPDFSDIEYKGRGVYRAGKALLTPIGGLFKKEPAEAERDKVKIIFWEDK